MVAGLSRSNALLGFFQPLPGREAEIFRLLLGLVGLVEASPDFSGERV